MSTIASLITSLAVVYSTVYSDADQRKHQSAASLAFVRGIHRDRWIPRTMASYAENVSIWWRHHEYWIRIHVFPVVCGLTYSASIKKFVRVNICEIVVCKGTSILSWPHCINTHHCVDDSTEAIYTNVRSGSNFTQVYKNYFRMWCLEHFPWNWSQVNATELLWW